MSLVALTEIEIVAYLGAFLLSLFFSLLASMQKASVPCFISTVCWYALAGFHLAYLYDNVFMTFTWVYSMLGTIFLLYGIGITILNIQAAAKNEEFEIR